MFCTGEVYLPNPLPNSTFKVTPHQAEQSAVFDVIKTRTITKYLSPLNQILILDKVHK